MGLLGINLDLLIVLIATMICACAGRQSRRSNIPPIEAGNNQCAQPDCRGDDGTMLCGSDGRTYTSQCKKRIAICQDPTLKFEDGKCQESKVCKTSREHALQRIKHSRSFYVPVCNQDGSYAPLQCAMGNCWCADRLGKILRKKNKNNKIPKCGKHLKHTNKCKARVDRISFAYKLRGIILMDYRLQTSGSAIADSPSAIESAVRWKMESYTRGRASNFMYYREFRNMFRPYRWAISKHCGKAFPKHCDTNGNKEVSENELLHCMDVYIDTPTISPGNEDSSTPMRNIGLTTSDIDNHTTRDTLHDMPGTESRPSRITCGQSLEGRLQRRDPNIHIPTCEGANNEFYRIVQCHEGTGFCYCVNRDDGKPIPNTSVVDGEPDCNIPKPRPIPGCKTPHKDKFLASMMSVLVNEWSQRDRSQEGPNDNILELSDHERAARWYFDTTSNNEGVFGKKEYKAFRKILTKRKVKHRKCLRKLSTHCDRDRNLKTTVGEFILCLEINLTKPSSRSRKISPMPSIIISQLKTTDDPEGY